MARNKTYAALAMGIVLSLSAPPIVMALDETPATELRVTLDRLLSEHAFLTIQAIHAGVTDNDQFAAAAGALEANTSELEAAFGGIYGEDGGQRFGDLWRAHIGYVVDYTRARQSGDEDGEQAAVDGMAAYQEDFAAFVAGANPHLSEEALHVLLEDHLGQLQQVANVQAGDYDAVYRTARDAYHHMFVLGDGLAEAIATQFPQTFGGSAFAFGPAVDLRIVLDQLLGEHAFLAAEVMRLAQTSQDAERAAADALAANGDSIRIAIEDIYGEAAGRGFADIWEQHNGHYVDYVRAKLSDDAQGATRARASLEGFTDAVADFFIAATDLPDAEPLRAALAAHTSHLLEQVDAHHAGDHVASFDIAREAHRHMGAISDVLATGIANQFPGRFLPDTASHPSHGIPWVSWLALAVVGLLGVLGLLDRRSSGQSGLSA